VCVNDEARCVTCDSPLCNEDKSYCEECGNTICQKSDHTIERRYLGVKKKFCSEKCQSQYDNEYRSKSSLGKLRSSIGKKKHD